MQNSMYYTTTGLSSLPEYQGGGYLDQYGRQQYGLGKFVKKITKPIAKVLDKVVPNEIKPALPFIAAALPFLAPGLLSGIGGLFTTNPALQGYIGGSLVNAGTQLAQEGADKRGLNFVSNVLSGIGGSISTPGVGSEFSALKTLPTPGVSLEGIDSLSQLGYAPSVIPTQSVNLSGIDSLDQLGYNIRGTATSPVGELSQLDKLRNTTLSIGEKGATIFDKGRAALEEGDIFSKNFLTASVPGQVGAFADKAYVDASNALDKYNKQQISLGEMGVATTEGRKAAIRNAMQLSGYTNDEIENTILKFNFANGGRVGYQLGGGTKPPSMPMNPDMLAMAIFGKSYDELTYTQKSAINDMLPNKKAEGGRIGYEGGGPISLGMELYLMAKKTFEEQGYNPKEAHEKALEASGIKSVVKEYGPGVKKAEGGIMNLGGLEMDLRAKGGFVPIGRKEKADDVPARLSKNEFVMTANAVRGAGKGDVKKGAKRMYNLMRQYEARA